MSESKNLSDEQIVEITRTKDKNLYAEIIRRYQAKLLRYVTYLINDEVLAADIVQETFIKAYVGLNGFAVNKKFSSWMYRIAHNQAMTVMSKQKQHQPIDAAFEIDSAVNLENELIQSELLHHARECLEKMPLRYREPFSLFYLEEKSYDEISDILRIPIGTVGTRINRAKIMVKKICKKNQ